MSFSVNKEFSQDHKRTALYLYSLNAHDREWILNQLPDSQAQILDQFLVELAALGMPKDGFLLSEPQKSKKYPTRDRLDNVGTIPRLNALDLQDLTSLVPFIEATPLPIMNKIFEHEPLEVISLFLRLRKWEWHHSFIEQFDASRRFQLKETLKRDTGLSGVVLTPKFQTAFLGSIATKIAEAEVELGSAVRGASTTGSGSAKSVSAWLKKTILRRDND